MPGKREAGSGIKKGAGGGVGCFERMGEGRERKRGIINGWDSGKGGKSYPERGTRRGGMPASRDDGDVDLERINMSGRDEAYSFTLYLFSVFRVRYKGL